MPLAVLIHLSGVLRKGTYPDGSASGASGREFGEGEFNGMDVTVKDSKRFASSNGWGFFNFGHHPLAYEPTAKNASKEECAGYHIAGAGKTDLTWVDFYPVLRGKELIAAVGARSGAYLREGPRRDLALAPEWPLGKRCRRPSRTPGPTLTGVQVRIGALLRSESGQTEGAAGQRSSGLRLRV